MLYSYSSDAVGIVRRNPDFSRLSFFDFRFEYVTTGHFSFDYHHSARDKTGCLSHAIQWISTTLASMHGGSRIGHDVPSGPRGGLRVWTRNAMDVQCVMCVECIHDIWVVSYQNIIVPLW